MATTDRRFVIFLGVTRSTSRAARLMKITFTLLLLIAVVGGRPTDARGATVSQFFVTNHSNVVTGYAAGANGNVPPVELIGGSNTGLDQPYGIAVDQNDNLYVANASANSVTIYGAETNGNVPPIVTIVGPSTGLSSPLGIAVDCLGFIYVANSKNDSVTVYAPDSHGDAVPVITIAGASTGLKSPFGIALIRR